jgi:dienelactone hydrolase
MVTVGSTHVPAATRPSAVGVSHYQAAGHPMRYHVALPAGWKAGSSWPVLVVVPDAHRDFTQNLMRFAEARGSRRLILVAPEVLSCGGERGKTTPPYAYTPAEWEVARRAAESDFDDQGLAAVLRAVHARWGGETRAFLTGWEAGGHTVWAQALRRPERWRGIAPVTPNYQGRGLTPATFSTDAARATLPIQVFWCGAPTGEEAATAMPFLRTQTDRAMADARSHGFAPAPIRVVHGADHGPLPGPVLVWVDSLARRGTGGR